MDLCTKVKALPYNVYRRRGYSMVEQTLETRLALIDSGPYIDIFGRREREGWTVWGA